MSPSIPDRATAPPGEPSPIADEHAAPQPGHRLPAAPLWFKRAIFYEIHIRGFFDANGDGSGDFRGLIEKLDYLHWLGIDCIWLLPMYPSPLRDGGYDIASFATIHPDYGTVDDFRRFVDLAHQRGIRALADLVLNHTSIDHPWFEESRSSSSSPRRDWYVWSDTDDRYKDAPIIFSDTERSNWTWDPVAGQYYWHRFFHHQPDLNYENPEVQEAPPHPVLTGHSIRPRRSACRESRGRVWRKVSRVAPARAVTSPRRGAKCAGARAARRGSSCACCAASRSISWPGRRASRRAGSARGARSSCSPEVWARLRLHGVGTSRKRVLRLTREAGLLAPTARVRKRAARLHDGMITVVTVPDTLWATDATDGWSLEGRCAVFVMIDHASGEAWCDAGLRLDRFAAADLLREVCTERFGSIEHAVASGLALRYDGGPCFRSEHYQCEIDHLGIARSPAYHYEPETNGAARRSSSRRSRSRCSGSNASPSLRSSAPPSASSPAPTTASGCWSAAATARRSRPASTCSRSHRRR